MRINTALYSCLVSLSTSVLAIENAAVYRFPSSANDETDAETRVISEADSILNLAYDLDISKYYELSSSDNLNDVFFGNTDNDNEDSGNGNGNGKNIIIIVNGLSKPDEFLSNNEVRPNFQIDLKDDRQLSNFKNNFIKKISIKLNSISNLNLFKLSNQITVLSKFNNNSSLTNLKNLWVKIFNKNSKFNKIDNLWNSKFKENQELLNLNNLNANSISYINDESYINELIQFEFFFNNFLDNFNEVNSNYDKILITSDSLINIFKKTGTTQTYETCKNLLSKLIFDNLSKLQKLNSGYKFTLVTLPLDQMLVIINDNDNNSSGSSNNNNNNNKFKRDDEYSSINSVFSSSTVSCFKNELSCLESTDACSSHGKCIDINGCWKCVCKPSTLTTDGNSVKTTYWTGNSCEKIDYSSQFNLLFWTGLIIVLAIVSGVKLMYKCGTEELPGVLLAATVNTKAAN